MRTKLACLATETICKVKILPVASVDTSMVFFYRRLTKALISLRGCAGWSAPLLFADPRRQIFSGEAQMPVLDLLWSGHP